MTVTATVDEEEEGGGKRRKRTHQPGVKASGKSSKFSLEPLYTGATAGRCCPFWAFTLSVNPSRECSHRSTQRLVSSLTPGPIKLTGVTITLWCWLSPVGSTSQACVLNAHTITAHGEAARGLEMRQGPAWVLFLSERKIRRTLVDTVKRCREPDGVCLSLPAPL